MGPEQSNVLPGNPPRRAGVQRRRNAESGHLIDDVQADAPFQQRLLDANQCASPGPRLSKQHSSWSSLPDPRGSRAVREGLGAVAKQSFTIVLEGHGCAAAGANDRVLVALERAQNFGRLQNLPRRLPVGCRRGGCGRCRVRVTQGAYRASPMSRAHISTQDEAAGVVLACCIYPQSDLSLRLETPLAVKAGGNGALQSVQGR